MAPGARAESHSPARVRTGQIQAWEDLRFGAFLHYNMNTYGPDTGPLNDYYAGDCRNADLFNPTRLDVAGWVRTFKEAGMGFAVLTARHIGGFLLWDSATTRYTSMHSRAVQADIVAEFVRECRKQGLAPGIYYLMGGGKGDTSSCPVELGRFGKAAVLAQLTELATNYGNIPYFWIDMMDWRPIRAQGDAEDLTTQEVYDLLKARQPDAVVHFNQHLERGTRIHYFPTDVVNGEETLPVPGFRPDRNDFTQANPDPAVQATDDNAGYSPDTFYLPFEFSFTGQVAPWGARTTPAGVFHDTLWFTRSTTHFEAARNLYVEAREALARGAAHVLLAAAPDQSGAMRAEDSAALALLGNLIDGHAALELEPGSLVTRVVDLGGLGNLGAVAAGTPEIRCAIEVGAKPVRVLKLGRFRAFGNSGRHRLRLQGPAGEAFGETSVDLSTGTPDANGFQYGVLALPVTLAAGARYALASAETATGDRVYASPSSAPPADARVRFAGPCPGPLNLVLAEDGGPAGEWELIAPASGAGAAAGAGPDAAETRVPDLSGHGNTATVHGLSRDAEGFLFDGGSGHLAVENSGSLAFTGKIRLEARIRPARTDGVRNIVAHGYTRAPAREVFLRIHDGRYEAGSWGGESAGTIVSAPVPARDLGTWVELAAEWDGGRWNLYRNGRRIATRADAVGAVAVPADWAIGGCARGWCADGETRGFAGGISRVRISR